MIRLRAAADRWPAAGRRWSAWSSSRSAVALGVGLLLTTLAGINAVNTQNARYAWLNTGVPAARALSAGQDSAASQADPLWWDVHGDYFDGKTIGRVDVAATGPHSPVPPGIPALPGPGEFYASPALAALLAATPADQLADRFPGHQIGTIGDAALPAPDSLHHRDRAHRRRAVDGCRAPPASTSIANRGTGRLRRLLRRVGARPASTSILSVVAAALLFPVLIFIGAATRLSAARREQRFAAMRLVGATPRQISVISAVESVAAAVVGTAVGFGLFFALRDPLAAIPFTGAPFFPATCRSTSPTSWSSRSASRSRPRSPPGSRCAGSGSRRSASPDGSRPRPPRWYRLIPLALGLGELAWFVGHRPPTTERARSAVFLPGISGHRWPGWSSPGRG